MWLKTDSTDIWRLKIISPKACSLNFIFSELYLPKDAELYIFNEDGSMVYGPVSEKQNQHGENYLTDIIQGESVTIQISMPLNVKGKSSLTIRNIIHGYKDIFKSLKIGYGDAGECFGAYDSDVVCYPTWNNESDGTVQILLSDGYELCSGSLLNNTAQDYIPYILTAFHCIDQNLSGDLSVGEISDAEEWLIRFRFRHTTCGGSTIANVITYDDAHFRAAWDTTDFALVECQDNIINDVSSVGQKVWLGWDRTSNTPTSGTCIHHPKGDIMKLSIADNSISSNTNSFTIQGIQFLANRFWQVQWDDGVVEGGSSGAPLLNSDHKVVGQLLGGDVSCSNQDGDSYFGRFNLSWAGGRTNATRLSNWLEPSGSATTLNSIRQPIPEYSGIDDPLCSTDYFSVTNLAPGYSIHHWSGYNVTFPNGNTGNPVLVSAGSQGIGWVQAVINTGGGQYTMDREYFWVGPEMAMAFSPFDLNQQVYTWYPLCVGTPYEFRASLRHPSEDPSDYFWTVWDSEEELMYMCPSGTGGYFVANHPGNYTVNLVFDNGCGQGNEKSVEFEFEECGRFFLQINPNPTSSESTIELKSIDASQKVDINQEWQLEVYSESQLLKEKKTRLKGSKCILNTDGWKEGVYIVRVIYKDTVLQGKLIVKK